MYAVETEPPRETEIEDAVPGGAEDTVPHAPGPEPVAADETSPEAPAVEAGAPGSATAAESGDHEAPSPRRPWRRAALVAGLAPVAFYLLCILGLIYVRFLPPVTTGVQLQRTVERLIDDQDPLRDYRWRPMDEISPGVPRAVVAAEDARFYQHAGFDWKELRSAMDEAERTGEPMRGASTITQQLVKNLFFTTHRNPLRKAFEWALTPPAEFILGKDRILELYVNVVELGPGIFGAEAASQHYFGVSADRLTRHQSASLAAILPAPLRRRPQAMVRYTSVIEGRMARMGW